MINKILVVCIFLFCLSCSGQKEKIDDISLKNVKMKKLDIENFKKNWSKGGAFFNKDNGTQVSQYKTDDGYDEIINKYAPDFTSEYNTYYQSGFLKSSLHNFSDVTIGKSYEFDDKNNLISEKNEDEKFGKVRYTDILKFLSEKQYLDLETGKGWYLDNGNNAIKISFEEPSKIWVIRITSGKIGKGEKTGSALMYDNIFRIDGETGKVIDNK